MDDNEYIVADLECNKSAFYYSMGHNQEVIREVFRDISGNLFIRFPHWGLVPLGKDTPEVLIGKVPTSLELTTRISAIQKEFSNQITRLQEKIEVREELLLKLCVREENSFFNKEKEAALKAIRDHLARIQKDVTG
jgi:hypothetical protein